MLFVNQMLSKSVYLLFHLLFKFNNNKIDKILQWFFGYHSNKRIHIGINYCLNLAMSRRYFLYKCLKSKIKRQFAFAYHAYF